MTEKNGDPSPAGSGQEPPGTSHSHLSISGGHNSGNIAMGTSGPVTQYSYRAAAAGELAQIEDLLGQLEAGLRQLDGAAAEDALDDVAGIRQEMNRRQPEPARLTQLLGRISAVVAPMSGLLELADRARELIMAIVR
jgi:hypothetical protein